MSEHKEFSLLEGYTENTEIFRGDLNKIDTAAFEQLVETHGLQFALGYLKAMHEVTEVVGKIMVQDFTTFQMERERYQVYNHMSNLHKALFIFLTENGINTTGILPPHRNYPRLNIF